LLVVPLLPPLPDPEEPPLSDPEEPPLPDPEEPPLPDPEEPPLPDPEEPPLPFAPAPSEPKLAVQAPASEAVKTSATIPGEGCDRIARARSSRRDGGLPRQLMRLSFRARDFDQPAIAGPSGTALWEWRISSRRSVSI